MKPPTAKGLNRVDAVLVALFVLRVLTNNDTIGGLWACAVLYRVAYGFDFWRQRRRALVAAQEVRQENTRPAVSSEEGTPQ